MRRGSLLTLAQLAVTFAGFSALVALFQTTRDAVLDEGEGSASAS